MPTLFLFAERVIEGLTLFRGRLHLPRIVPPSTHGRIFMDTFPKDDEGKPPSPASSEWIGQVDLE